MFTRVHVIGGLILSGYISRRWITSAENLEYSIPRELIGNKSISTNNITVNFKIKDCMLFDVITITTKCENYRVCTQKFWSIRRVKSVVIAN